MEAPVVCYPPIEGLATSEDLAVEVNGQSVWVERYTSTMDLAALPRWFTSEPYTSAPQVVNIVNFACDGPLRVTMTAAEPVESVAVHPAGRGIRPAVDGRRVRFTLPGPDKLYITINDLPAVCFFANAVEAAPPRADDPGVLYFAPGVHRPGPLTLQDGQTVYLAPGAIVYGCLRGGPKNARVLGHGILDGQYEHRLVRLDDAADVTIKGVILRNGRSWQNTITGCRDVTYRDVKVISFGNSGDGINPVGSSNVTIDNCFLRCTDDCVAIKSMRPGQNVQGIRVLNSTMIGYAFADGITIGFETHGPEMKDILVRNCDIVLSRGGNAVGRHSAFSIIADGPGWIRDVRFENLRVQADVDRLFELHVTDGTAYVKAGPGHIQGVHLKDIAWTAPKPIILAGLNEDHLVEDVVFENCTVAGRPLRSADAEIVTINPHVRNVAFR
ncbi:MAG: hypothetical protein GX591_01715 [Planctomycetes bacterium]|nr:hypothetical protein [Planctomycetota bacterium]